MLSAFAIYFYFAAAWFIAANLTRPGWASVLTGCVIGTVFTLLEIGLGLDTAVPTEYAIGQFIGRTVGGSLIVFYAACLYRRPE